MQMAKYSRAFTLHSSKKKESATTPVCNYKNVNVQTSSSVSLQYRKCEIAFSFVLFKLSSLIKYIQNIYNNYQSS